MSCRHDVVLSRVERIGDSMSLRRKLNPIARRFGFYTAYMLDDREFVGELPNAPVWWQTHGYESNPTVAGIPLSAAKIHPSTGQTHDISVRKVDPENTQKQYHLHYWLESVEEGYEAELFSHHEYRPDLKILEGETLSDAIERLRTHYRPEWGESYIRGKADQTVRELVE